MGWASDVWKSIKHKKNHRAFLENGVNTQLEKDNSPSTDIDNNHTSKATVINNLNSTNVA